MMSGATEIYICKPGQTIKEGAVVYSDIETRGEAEADAAYRIKNDPGIAKIAYYAVKEDGSFRSLYSVDNPHAPKVPKSQSLMMDEPKERPVAERPPTLLGRIRAVFEED
ncbi:MAG: hypothetical protein HOM58_15990 [Rhodospirillaceae bacterium]|jgi:hypothetical protein|nr:hypothetical protein [Rhodospirillaceae bacterium]MBT5459538.1 hypothetical protein [Rhodospirillaceae bacterium]